MYKCSLWKRTPIELYLSENYVCIRHEEPEGNGEQKSEIISWSDVTAIKKRKCFARDTAISIHYSNGKEESKELFCYGFQQRDEVAGIMDQLWQNLMSKILRSAENNTSIVSESILLKRKGSSASVITDRVALENNHVHSNYNRLFRLPSDEKHLMKISCRTWEGSGFKTGKIFISKHFLCYQTTKGKDIRVSFCLLIYKALERK